MLAVLALGAGLVLIASSQDWVDLPGRTAVGSGAEVAPAARALGLVGLAGVVAVPATRGIARRVAGVALVLAGAGAAVATVLAAPGPEVRDVAPDAAAGGPWWVASLVGACCLTVAGSIAVSRCGRWPSMGARYEAPGSLGRDDAWAMLDRGEDPTVRSDRNGLES